MESKLNRFIVHPILKLPDGRWTINDQILKSIWDHLEAQGKVEHLFYDGLIRDAPAFINYLTQPGIFPVLVIDTKNKQIVHLSWLKDVFDGAAWAHHVSLGPYRRGVWEVCRDYWQELGAIHILLGLTPISNEKAIKFVTNILKWTIVGEVPYVCNMAYFNKRSPGLISYYELKPLQEKESRPEKAHLQKKRRKKKWAAAEKAVGKVEVAEPVIIAPNRTPTQIH